MHRASRTRIQRRIQRRMHTYLPLEGVLLLCVWMHVLACVWCSCHAVQPGHQAWAYQSWTIVSVAGNSSDASVLDDRLYSVDLEHAPSLETAAAMSPALQASLSPRVDLELQKLAQVRAFM